MRQRHSMFSGYGFGKLGVVNEPDNAVRSSPQSIRKEKYQSNCIHSEYSSVASKYNKKL